MQSILIFIIGITIFLRKGPVYDQSALAPNVHLAMIWATDARILWYHVLELTLDGSINLTSQHPMLIRRDSRKVIWDYVDKHMVFTV